MADIAHPGYFTAHQAYALAVCRAEHEICPFGCTKDGAPNCDYHVQRGECEPGRRTVADRAAPQPPLIVVPDPHGLAGLPRRLLQMHAAFGHAEGHKCGECKHIYRQSMGGTWFKCRKSRVSGSAATDWRLKWPACGLFEQREEHA